MYARMSGEAFIDGECSNALKSHSKPTLSQPGLIGRRECLSLRGETFWVCCGYKLILSKKGRSHFFVVVVINHSDVLKAHFLVVVLNSVRNQWRRAPVQTVEGY